MLNLSDKVLPLFLVLLERADYDFESNKIGIFFCDLIRLDFNPQRVKVPFF